MLIILLCKQNKNFSHLQEELKYENITLENRIWDGIKPLPRDVFEADAVVIFCNSPDMGILNAIPDIKKKKYLLPIIVLDINRNEETNKQARLLGADEYCYFPISSRDLSLKIKNLMSKKEDSNIHCKWMRAFGLWLDIERRAVKRCNRWIGLRNKEYSLLEFFIINRGRVLSRNSILEHVWDRNADLASNTVDVHVNRLRRKIDDRFRDKLIHTVYCIGYCFDKRKKE